MDLRKLGVPRALTSLQEWTSTNTVGSAGVAIGIVLIAVGWILEEEAIGIGAAVRSLGGVFFLAGLATVVFGDSRRRAVSISMSRRISARYMSRTAHWGWPDRVGLAGAAVGLALVVPALVLQIIFRNGAVVAGPAVILFWVGVILLIYGRFHGRGEAGGEDMSSPDPRAMRRGRGRL